MKLLLDENLSPGMVASLAGVFSGIQHVDQAGLGGSDDSDVWDYAIAHGFAIVSKDSDFNERSVLEKRPPKIIWIRAGNCSTAAIEQLLIAAKGTIHSFVQQDRETCLQLGRAR